MKGINSKAKWATDLTWSHSGPPSELDTMTSEKMWRDTLVPVLKEQLEQCWSFVAEQSVKSSWHKRAADTCCMGVFNATVFRLFRNFTSDTSGICSVKAHCHLIVGPCVEETLSEWDYHLISVFNCISTSHTCSLAVIRKTVTLQSWTFSSETIVFWLPALGGMYDWYQVLSSLHVEPPWCSCWVGLKAPVWSGACGVDQWSSWSACALSWTSLRKSSGVQLRCFEKLCCWIWRTFFSLSKAVIV